MKESKVIAVSRSPAHTMQKMNVPSIVLLDGLGVEGDAHMGVTVKHRSRVAADPNQPNLRQVHLIHSELFEELEVKGFQIKPGQMGENITTVGVDLLNLPRHSKLHLGPTAVLEITGLRNPCHQLNGIQDGLMNALVYKDEDQNIVRKAGIMSIVLRGGEVKPGDLIRVELPPAPHYPLERV